MSEFQKVIEDISIRFFEVKEFPLLNRNRFPQGCLNKVMDFSESDLMISAARLKGIELEGLIHDILLIKTKAEIERVAQVIYIRYSKRIINLITSLYLYNFKNDGINKVIQKIASFDKLQADFSKEAAFVKNFGGKEDIFVDALIHIEANGNDIKEFSRAFNLRLKTPLGRELCLYYFAKAGKDGMLNNKKYLILTIDEETPERLFELISNYLTMLAMIEFNEGVNLAILGKLGRPFESVEWEKYGREQKDLFNQWMFMHALKIHASFYKKKFLTLRKYADQVRTCYNLDEDTLIIDFGEIIVVDIAQSPHSFFYEKKRFDKEMKAWKDDEEAVPTFLKIEKKITSARDFMIEEFEETCMKLTYDGVDVLYIYELMDIKMGIEPDMRRKNLAKKINR